MTLGTPEEPTEILRFLLAFVPWNDAAFFGFLFFFLFGVAAPSVVAAAAFIADIAAPSDADLATDVFFLRFLTTLDRKCMNH